MKKLLNNNKYLYLLLFFPISIILIEIAKQNEELIEIYFSNYFYNSYSKLIGNMFGYFPFSVGELLLYLTILIIIIQTLIHLYMAIKNKSIIYIIKLIFKILSISSLVYFLFTISCGLNYYRTPIKNDYENYDYYYSSNQLKELCIYLINEAAKYSDNVQKELEEFNFNKYSEITQNDVMIYLSKNNIKSKVNSVPKKIFLSEYLSYTNITGVFFPFTFEANINSDVYPMSASFTMLHEQVHQIGYMFEDEANFLAWMIGKDSTNELVRYSVYMQASIYTMNSLYKVDSELYKEAYSYYNEQQKENLDSNNEYWGKYDDNVIENTANNINDYYLKSNGQNQGVISYSEVTRLLLAEYYR